MNELVHKLKGSAAIKNQIMELYQYRLEMVQDLAIEHTKFNRVLDAVLKTPRCRTLVSTVFKNFEAH